MNTKKKQTLEQIRVGVRELLIKELAKNENKSKGIKQFLIDFVDKLPPDYWKYVLLQVFSLGVTAAQLKCKPEDADDPKSFLGRMLQEGVMRAVDGPVDSEPDFQLTEKGREMFIEVLFGD